MRGKKVQKQFSQYDNIIRENLEATLPVLIREILGLDISESRELPDDQLQAGRLNFSYTIVSISQVSYKLFLNSESPEGKMLGVLADFEGSDNYSILKLIIEGVKDRTTSDFAESRYFRQLRIFVQLRSSIGQQFEKIMETVTNFFKEEEDYLFRKGEIRGEARGAEKERAKATAEKLDMAREMKKNGLLVEQIAKFTRLTLEQVKNLK